MKKLKTAKRDVRGLLGSPEYVALYLCVSRRTIFYWKATNQISRASRLDVFNMLKDAGYTNITLKKHQRVATHKKRDCKMIELLHCDCMEYMATVPDKYFDLAIVDPPYGIGEMVANGKNKKQKGKDVNMQK